MNKTPMTVAALIILAALAVFSLALRSDRAGQLEALENRIEELEHRIAELDATPVDAAVAARSGTLEAAAVEEQISKEADSSSPETIQPEVMARLQDVEQAVTETGRTLSKAIDKRVDERVAEVIDKKMSKLEKKQNPKPPLSDFIEVLELDEDQQGAVEDVIWLGQDAVRAILETPTEDGTILVDGLVEALAYGAAKHPEAGQVFMDWVGQVMSTKIPGSDDTYAWRVESAKNDVRDALRRELTEEQYAEFERWKVDPTEVQEIQDSPWSDLGERIEQRALELAEWSTPRDPPAY